MPQLSSTDRLLMAANDIPDALKHPRPDLPFAQVNDDTITVLAKLAAIFKKKFQKPAAPELIQAPLKAYENKQSAALVQQILTSPMKHNYQTRSQRPTNVNPSSKTPLLPRVVTPMTGRAASPRVPARTQNISPRSLSQDDFWNMETANQAIALGTNHWTNFHFSNAVVHPIMNKEMEYMALMKDPDLQPLWKRGFGNEVGRLFQGIRDIQGTNKCFFVTEKSHIKKLSVTISLKIKKRVILTVGGDKLDYSGEVATSTADITTFKILINITLSTKDSEMMMMDIKNYYMSTPLHRYEYMHMLL
jgi:hypothetical protein